MALQEKKENAVRNELRFRYYHIIHLHCFPQVVAEVPAVAEVAALAEAVDQVEVVAGRPDSDRLEAVVVAGLRLPNRLHRSELSRLRLFLQCPAET